MAEVADELSLSAEEDAAVSASEGVGLVRASSRWAVKMGSAPGGVVVWSGSD